MVTEHYIANIHINLKKQWEPIYKSLNLINKDQKKSIPSLDYWSVVLLFTSYLTAYFSAHVAQLVT